MIVTYLPRKEPLLIINVNLVDNDLLLIWCTCINVDYNLLLLTLIIFILLLYEVH